MIGPIEIAGLLVLFGLLALAVGKLLWIKHQHQKGWIDGFDGVDQSSDNSHYLNGHKEGREQRAERY